jgi:hypothetical protein
MSLVSLELGLTDVAMTAHMFMGFDFYLLFSWTGC